MLISYHGKLRKSNTFDAEIYKKNLRYNKKKLNVCNIAETYKFIIQNKLTNRRLHCY